MNTPEQLTELVRSRFVKAGIQPRDVSVRNYPGETIIVVEVPAPLDQASDVAKSIDAELARQEIRGFVTVRAAGPASGRADRRLVDGVKDSRAMKLADLITARARTSLPQPSLHYIPDAGDNVRRATTQRHHLIFGRRGAGKTALMLETKRRVEEERAASVWFNVQTYRDYPAATAFVWISRDICRSMLARADSLPELSEVQKLADDLSGWINDRKGDAGRFKPRLNGILKRSLSAALPRLYIFVDDLHYLNRKEQPLFLDMLHGAVRDCDVWLKVAGVRHLCRWFQTNPPVGLQAGQDADEIDLDVTLEEPGRAKRFFGTASHSYAKHVKIPSRTAIFSPSALDRLLLAAGAVPRDFLMLSAASIRQARERDGRKVGVQDVSNAAGEAETRKISELEEDAVAQRKLAGLVLGALDTIREFCVNERQYTYFRIDSRDRENCPNHYEIVQQLMDSRLIHLIESSLSDQHRAGTRSEVYMLDVSEFSGQRFRKGIHVLEFRGQDTVLRRTGITKELRRASTPRQRLDILRLAPLFQLNLLAVAPKAATAHGTNPDGGSRDEYTPATIPALGR
ncbi:MAG: ATP-binding protein [Deltaproteobacteria bacterium]|nr:ATP-binding protein [Deltaproteobacteria bacterium]